MGMRKLFGHDTLRHRLEDLPDFSLDSLPFMHREEKSRPLLFLAAGALAGLAAGYFVSQKLGGISGIADRLRGKKGFRGTSLRGGPAHGAYDEDLFGDEEMGAGAFHPTDLSPNEELEERVLEAFYNDPILCERAVDIGALEDGIIELTGWVNTPDEATHAVTIANGVPGVETIVNRLTIRLEEAQRDFQAVMYNQGDPSLTEAQWEGEQAGLVDNAGETGMRKSNVKTKLDNGVPRGDHVPEPVVD
jgi:hypothetical protein